MRGRSRVETDRHAHEGLSLLSAVQTGPSPSGPIPPRSSPAFAPPDEPPDPAERALRGYHELARADVQHDDTRRWTLFSAFLIAETVLTTLLGRGHNAIVALLGMTSTILIGLAIWRNNVYLRDRSILASRLESAIGPADDSLRFYDRRARIPATRLAEQRGYGLARNLQRRISHSAVLWLHAWATMRLTLAAAFIAWAGVALVALHVPGRYVATIVVGFAGLVLLDWALEINQRIRDA